MRYFKCILASLFLCTFYSCTKILDTDLLTTEVKILSPADNDSSSAITKTFWWNNVDGANAYNIQIVTPSFDGNVTLIIDTTVTKNKLVYTLKSNKKYQWPIS